MTDSPGLKLAYGVAGPLVLTGPPDDVHGQLHVHNPGDGKRVVRKPMVKVGAHAELDHVMPTDRTLPLRRIVVRPGQSRAVRLSLALDPRTPPGTYQAQLEVDGDVRDVVLHVTEAVSLRIDPGELVLPSRAGQSFDKRVVFSNEGNVPVPVRPVGAVVVDDELAHCRALRGALADVGETMQRLDDFVVALGRRYAGIYAPLIVRVKNEAVEVNPGESVAVGLTISLPDKLDSRCRYSASIPISTSTLQLAIVPD